MHTLWVHFFAISGADLFSLFLKVMQTKPYRPTSSSKYLSYFAQRVYLLCNSPLVFMVPSPFPFH